jgi:hypothetical protein
MRHVANGCKVLTGKSERLRLFTRPRCRCEDSIERQLKKKRLKTCYK